MKFVILISFCFVFCSCSSFHRFGTQKYFKVKTIRDIDSPFIKNKSNSILYFETRDDESCFESNPGNKDTITVAEDNTEFALDHFYKRVSKVNVTVTRRSGRDTETKVDVIETVPFDLEMATCLSYTNPTMPWYGDDPIRFVSFRLAN